MKYCGKTDIGRKREKNEDCFLIERVADNAAMLIVCDGMGGAAGGEIASAIAAESFITELKYQLETKMNGGNLSFFEPEAEIPMALDSALANANYEVWQRAQADPEFRGMGTTLAGLFILESPLSVYTVNIGDSRVYRVESNRIERLTKDHSYVQLLLDNGEITQKEADSHPNRNVITRALGRSVAGEGDIKKEEISSGDIVLICSDGLYSMLTDDEMQGVASFGVGTLETKLERLVSLANDAGGDDNITVILVEL